MLVDKFLVQLLSQSARASIRSSKCTNCWRPCSRSRHCHKPDGHEEPCNFRRVSRPGSAQDRKHPEPVVVTLAHVNEATEKMGFGRLLDSGQTGQTTSSLAPLHAPTPTPCTACANTSIGSACHGAPHAQRARSANHQPQDRKHPEPVVVTLAHINEAREKMGFGRVQTGQTTSSLGPLHAPTPTPCAAGANTSIGSVSHGAPHAQRVRSANLAGGKWYMLEPLRENP